MAIEIDVSLKNRNIDTTDPGHVRIGDVPGGNYSEFSKADGCMRYRGSATVWKDMVGDITGRRLSSVVGRVDYDWEENAILFQSGGSITNTADRVQLNQEINHEFAIGNAIVFKPHIHWFQDSSTQYEITLRHRIQRNGEPKTEAWTNTTLTANSGADSFAYTSGILNQITSFPDIILSCGVSDTIQLQMARTDSLGGTMSVYFMDIHGTVDSDGSEGVFTKEA